MVYIKSYKDKYQQYKKMYFNLKGGTIASFDHRSTNILDGIRERLTDLNSPSLKVDEYLSCIKFILETDFNDERFVEDQKNMKNINNMKNIFLELLKVTDGFLFRRVTTEHKKLKTGNRIGFGSYGNIYDITLVQVPLQVPPPNKFIQKSINHNIKNYKEIIFSQFLSCHSCNYYVSCYGTEINSDGISIFQEKYNKDTESLFQPGIHLSDNDKLEFITTLINGVNDLHSKGIIHQDIKPQNILYKKVNGAYKFVISDFGISNIKSNISEGGTKMYMLPTCYYKIFPKYPELIDYYAVGITILYSLLHRKELINYLYNDFPKSLMFLTSITNTTEGIIKDISVFVTNILYFLRKMANEIFQIHELFIFCGTAKDMSNETISLLEDDLRKIYKDWKQLSIELKNKRVISDDIIEKSEKSEKSEKFVTTVYELREEEEEDPSEWVSDEEEEKMNNLM